MPPLPPLTRTIIPICMKKPPTPLRTLRNPLPIHPSININPAGIPLQKRLIPHSPAHNTNLHRIKWPPIEPLKSSNPLIERAARSLGDLGSLGGGHALRRVPAHAVVYFPVCGEDLVEGVVLEAEGVGVCFELVVPDLSWLSTWFRLVSGEGGTSCKGWTRSEGGSQVEGRLVWRLAWKGVLGDFGIPMCHGKLLSLKG